MKIGDEPQTGRDEVNSRKSREPRTEVEEVDLSGSAPELWLWSRWPFYIARIGYYSLFFPPFLVNVTMHDLKRKIRDKEEEWLLHLVPAKAFEPIT